MPRGEHNYYHFKIHRLDDNGDDAEPTIVTRYFCNGFEASAYLGCSRPTLFKLIRSPEKCILSKHFTAEKCRIPKYEKVEVSNFEKW